MPQVAKLDENDIELLRNLHQVLDFMHEAVVILNLEGRLIYANYAYENTLGVPLNKVLGKYLSEIEPDVEAFKMLDGKNTYRGEYTFVKTVNKHIIGDALPIFNDNKLIGAIATFRDVSDIVKMNQKLSQIQINEKPKSASDALTAFTALKGRDEKLLSILNFAAHVAKTDMPVLIQGESGVGKDLLPLAIHNESHRKEYPFIAVNCAAISETLWESELFGYEPGAFTGANPKGKMGKFEGAQGGTLFLDEIAEIPLHIQAKLLRVLQNGEIEKVGSLKTIKVNTRVIAASNQNLKLLVDEGKFRADLFFRLNVISITLPPLRDRKVDIPILAEEFISRHSGPFSRTFQLSDEALQVLQNYAWPGNIRELENVIQYALVSCKDNIIRPLDLPESLFELGAASEKKDETLQDMIFETEKKALIKALEDCGNNRSKAMKLLGLSRKTFYKKLKKCGLL